MSRGSFYSDDESLLSYNNNCSSGTSDRNWSAEDRNWSVEDRNWSADESVKPLLSHKPTKSSPKKSSKPTTLRSDGRKTGSSNQPNKRKKGKKRFQTGLIALFRRIAKSDPSEHRLWKAALGFPIGLAIAGGLFFVVILPMDLDPDVRNLVGSLVGLVLAIGFAFSVQVGPHTVQCKGKSYLTISVLLSPPLLLTPPPTSGTP